MVSAMVVKVVLTEAGSEMSVGSAWNSVFGYFAESWSLAEESVLAVREVTMMCFAPDCAKASAQA